MQDCNNDALRNRIKPIGSFTRQGEAAFFVQEDTMSIQEILTAGGGTMIVLLTLVQIAPIKLNPWSDIIKWIGHALNAEVLEQQQKTQRKLEEHIQVDDERNANLLRAQILKFNDELIDDRKHTKEHFIEVLAIIDDYEDFCRDHPNYKNNRCTHAVANISRVYDERLQKHDFL